jgi:hypothetical protein
VTGIPKQEYLAMSEQYSPPERIFLQITDDGDEVGEGPPPDYDGVTWCSDRVFREDVEYLRRDGETVTALVEALELYLSLTKQHGENELDHYERVADKFQKQTGMMAPGKSAPDELEATRDREAEQEAWKAFLREPADAARKALAKARGDQ